MTWDGGRLRPRRGDFFALWLASRRSKRDGNYSVVTGQLGGVLIAVGLAVSGGLAVEGAYARAAVAFVVLESVACFVTYSALREIDIYYAQKWGDYR